MGQGFDGAVRLPGEEGAPLAATVRVAGDHLELVSGGEVLGSWREYRVRRRADGAFHLRLGHEEVLFRPEAPAEFATAMAVPLQPGADRTVGDEPDPPVAPRESGPGPARAIATGDGEDEDVLPAGLLTAIVVVSAVLVGVALVVMFLA